MSRRRYDSGFEPERKVVVRKKSGVLGKIVALIVGFVLGAGAVGGTVAAIGYYAYTKPVKQVVDKANGALPTKIDITKYLTEEYYEKSVKELLGSVKTTASEISSGKGSFGSLAKISPAVETYLRKAAKKLVDMGSTLTEDEITTKLLETKFSELTKYISNDLINSVQVGVLLQKTGTSYDKLVNDSIMMSALFGVEGEDYILDRTNKKILPAEEGKPFVTFGQLRENPKEIAFNIPLDSVMTDVKSNDKTMLYLLYGKEDIHFKLLDENIDGSLKAIQFVQADGTVAEKPKYAMLLPKQMTVHHDTTLAGSPWCLHNEYGEAVKEDENSLQEIEGASQVTKTVGDKTYYFTPRFRYTIDGVEYRLLEADASKGTPVPDDIRLLDKLTIHEYAPAYYVQVNEGTQENPQYTEIYYQANTIGALTNDNALFKNITQRLTLMELLDDAEVQNNIFLKHLSHSVIDELPQAINQLAIADVFEDEVYKKNGDNQFVDAQNFPLTKTEDGTWVREDGTLSERVLTGTWKYLLTDADPTDDENGEPTKPNEFKVTHIDKLVSNMKGNMQAATLGALVDDGIIVVEDPVEFKTATFIDGRLLTDFTIPGLINAIMNLNP